MKSLELALVINVAAAFSCQAATDLFHVDPWSGQDSAIASSQNRNDATQFSFAAQALGTPSEVSPLVAPVEDLFEKNYWYLVILDTKEVFTAPARWDTRDWLTLGGIAAGIGTVAAFDRDIERGIRGARNDTVTNIFDNVQPLGNEYAIGIVGSFYIYGEIFKDPRAKTTALDAISASAIASGIITNSFKYVIGRGRPTDGHGPYNFRPFSGQDSFSSGHTTEAFALASVISEHYNTPWVQVTSYGLATAVGYARLNNNRHWPSDVLAGAAIGTFVGKTVVHFNQHHRQISIQPIVGPDIHGAQMSLAW
jgi:membrane-associated phospholipid phosphatase